MVEERLPPLIALVGPTAVGKTKLSLDLALAIDGEIVSADSRLVYRGMDIGTAKPSVTERGSIQHHLIDVADPDQTLSLAEYQVQAYAAIDNIASRGRVPLLVGGSGQYIHAVVEGWQIPGIGPDPSLRADLEEMALSHGPQAVHDRLRELDPVAANRIDFRNVRRVVRALEVTLVAGRPISALQGKRPPPYRVQQIGMTLPRSILYPRIDERIDEMLDAGLVEEISALVAAGYDWRLPSMSALGYRQIVLHVRGEATLEECVALMRKETRRFVRQQATWFRLDDPQIHWFNMQLAKPCDIIAWAKQWLAA